MEERYITHFFYPPDGRVKCMDKLLVIIKSEVQMCSIIGRIFFIDSHYVDGLSITHNDMKVFADIIIWTYNMCMLLEYLIT